MNRDEVDDFLAFVLDERLSVRTVTFGVDAFAIAKAVAVGSTRRHGLFQQIVGGLTTLVDHGVTLTTLTHAVRQTVGHGGTGGR